MVFARTMRSLMAARQTGREQAHGDIAVLPSAHRYVPVLRSMSTLSICELRAAAANPNGRDGVGVSGRLGEVDHVVHVRDLCFIGERDARPRGFAEHVSDRKCVPAGNPVGMTIENGMRRCASATMRRSARWIKGARVRYDDSIRPRDERPGIRERRKLRAYHGAGGLSRIFSGAALAEDRPCDPVRVRPKKADERLLSPVVSV